MKRLNATPLTLTLAVSAICAFPAAALAQQPQDELVVSSARSVGASHQAVSVSRRVSYADLNLGTYSGAQEIEARVRSTAKALCDKLDGMYRTSGIDVETCVRRTISKGMADVRAAIAGAEKTRTASIASRK